MTRQATANASQYQERDWGIRLKKGEKRTLVANFNGATASTLSSADWSLIWDNGILTLVAGSTGSKTAVATITANQCGCQTIKCQATMADGSILVQKFVADVD